MIMNYLEGRNIAERKKERKREREREKRNCDSIKYFGN